jgi:predicted 3-demethylubiquinone-9 3-methyltransferase (glyoxalase superfamily)
MTAPSASTCLWFDNCAEDAARLYCSLVDDARVTNVFREQGSSSGRAFLVEFELAGQRLVAMNGGPHYTLTPAASIILHLDTQAEVDRIWSALLADGGTESRCGWLTDRFGLSWQIIPRALPRLLQSDPTGRVMQAMMAMVKIDIATLEAAAKG